MHTQPPPPIRHWYPMPLEVGRRDIRTYRQWFHFVEVDPPAGPHQIAALRRVPDGVSIDFYRGRDRLLWVSNTPWNRIAGHPHYANTRLPDYPYNPWTRQPWRHDDWRTNEPPELVAAARRTFGEKGLSLAVYPCESCGHAHSYRAHSWAEWCDGATRLCKHTLEPIYLLPVANGTTATNWLRHQAAQERRRQRLARLRDEVQAERAAMKGTR